jgi:streptogramin lyase
MADARPFLPILVPVNGRAACGLHRRLSPSVQTGNSARSSVRRFRVRAIAATVAAAVWLSLPAHAIPPLHAQFTAAQSIVPSGSLSYPYRVAIDASGNVYISNTQDNKVLKETLSQGVYTESVVVSSGLATPYGVAADASGNVYIADNGHNRVLKETFSSGSYTQSVVTTSALSYPTGVAVDISGNLYIADTGHGRVLKETPSGNSYTETALTYNSNFAQITGIAVDSIGNIFVSDIDNNAVYEEAYSAGSYTPSTVPTSGLNYPYDVAADASGNLYISDFTNKRIVLETNSSGSYTQSVIPTYNLGGPLGVAVDANGNLYIADTFGQNIKEVSKAGGSFGQVNVGSGAGPIYMLFEFEGGSVGDMLSVTSTAELTLGVSGLDYFDSGTGNCSAISYTAGDTCAIGVNLTPAVPGLRMGAAQLVGSGGVLAQGSLEGTGVGPQINFFAASDFFAVDVLRVADPFSPFDLTNPFDAAVDASGNVYVADYNQNAVYMETSSGGNFTQSIVASGLNNPEAVAVDSAGDVYIVDSGNNQILKETNFGGTWTGTAVLTNLDFPTGVAVDWLGNLYFSSFSDNAVYKETLSQGAYSMSTVVTGLNQPRKIAVDGSGNVYIADTGNSRVVMETLSGGSYTQTTLGSGMHYPYGVAVDASGSVYVADTINSRILKESLVGGSYTQSVFIPGPPAYGIALDGQGNLYFPDPADATVFEINYNTPPSLSFADSNLGTQSSDSPQSFSVINTGNAALSIQVPSSGSNPSLPAGFTLDSTTTCPQLGTGSSADSVPAGSTCTYAIDFIPQAVGSNAGSLILSDNSLNILTSTQSISLTGTGNSIPTTTAASSTTVGYSPNAQTVTLAASVTSTSGTVNAGTVTFTILQGSTPIGSATTSSTLTNGTASVSYTLPGGTAAGSYSILAVFNSGGAFSTSSDNSQTLIVSAASQTINFTPPATPQTYAPGLTIALSATGGASGSAVVLSVDGSSSGTGTILGSLLTVTGAGTLVIDANQAGNGNYAAATQAQTTVMVNKASQTISFTSPASPVTYAPGMTIALSATGGASGSAVVFTVDGSSTGTGTIAGGTLTVTGAGTLVIDANQAGNGNYTAAAQAQATVVVGKATATVVLGNLNQTYSGSPEAATVTTTPASLPVSLTYNGSPTAPTTSGSYTVVAAVNTTDYTGKATGTLVIGQAASAVSLTTSANPVLFDNPITLTATVSAAPGTPTGSVTFLNGTTPLGVATLSGGVATLTTSSLAAGPQSISAAYSGDTNFTSASSNALTETVSDFSLSNPGSGGGGLSQTVTPGGTATYMLALGPTNGTTFPVPVALSVSGLPPGATATITPQTLPAGSSLIDITLTIQLPSSSASVNQKNLLNRKLPPVFLSILLLPFIGRLRRAGKKLELTLSVFLLLAAGIAGIAGLSGCGSTNGFFAQAQKTYTITVTATSGTLSHSTAVTLTVE